MNNKMHQFTIDYITREANTGDIPSDCILSFDNKSENTDDGYISRRSSRQTPSPSDSGMESDHSPKKCEGRKNEDDNAISNVLLSLEKNAARYKTAADENADEKPSHSYIALISMAILSVRDKKMLLGDIYQYIKENFNYYNNEEKAWKNSIRHNLSLNECFIKAGRADNGKGNYWTIHPACIDDFAKGDFRRRQARRRARKGQKDAFQDVRSAYGYNVGYVPMTASHIGYHPYGGTTPQLYYPQSPALSSASNQSSLSSHSSSMSSSPTHTQCNTGYFPACSVSSNASSAASSSAMSAAAQRFLAEQANNTVFTMQALAQQQLAASLQFQNW